MSGSSTPISSKYRPLLLAVVLVAVVTIGGVAPFAGFIGSAAAQTADSADNPDSVSDCLDESEYNWDEECLSNLASENDVEIDNIDSTSDFLATVGEEDYHPDAKTLGDDFMAPYKTTETATVGDIEVKYTFTVHYAETGVGDGNGEEVADESNQVSTNVVGSGPGLRPAATGSDPGVASDGDSNVKIQWTKVTRTVYEDGEEVETETLRKRTTDGTGVLGDGLEFRFVEDSTVGDNGDLESELEDLQNIRDIIDSASDVPVDRSEDATGSLVDYSLDNEVSFSVFVQNYKASSDASAPHEYRPMPPVGSDADGEVDDFAAMMSPTSDHARVSGSNVNVGFAAFNVPSSTSMHLVVEATQYDNDAEVKVVTAGGEVLQTADLANSIEFNEEAASYVSDSNAAYIVLADDGGNVNQNIKCMSVVVNAENPETCDAGVVETEDPRTTDSEDVADDLKGALGDASASASLLDYEVQTLSFSETVRYASSYEDGTDELGYMEESLPTVSPAGTVTAFPKMVDGDTETAAEFSAVGELKSTVEVKNIQQGRNHALVMDYSLVSGDAPDVTVMTANDEAVEVDGSALEEQDGLIAVDLEETGLSESINTHGVAYVVIESDDGMSAMDISCLSIVGNVDNPDNVACNGSLGEYVSGGTSIEPFDG